MLKERMALLPKQSPNNPSLVLKFVARFFLRGTSSHVVAPSDKGDARRPVAGFSGPLRAFPWPLGCVSPRGGDNGDGAV